MTTKTPAQVLTEAADHIERVGLHKGGFFQHSEVAVPLEERSCCALGAIGLTSGYFKADAHANNGWCTVYGYTGSKPDDEPSTNAVATLDEAAIKVLQDQLNRELADRAISVPGWSDYMAKDGAEVAAMMRKAAEEAGR